MTFFFTVKSDVCLYHTVELLSVTFHVLVAKVYIMTGAHYVTLCKILLFVIYKPLWSVAQKLLLWSELLIGWYEELIEEHIFYYTW